MSLIVCALFGEGIITPCLVILKPRYSKLAITVKTFILKLITYGFYKTILALLRWSSKLLLLMIKI